MDTHYVVPEKTIRPWFGQAGGLPRPGEPELKGALCAEVILKQFLLFNVY